MIGKSISNKLCKLKTLYLASNDFYPSGAELIIRGLISNISLIDIDLSSNHLDETIAESLSLVPRGLYVKGLKFCDSNLKRILLNDNPLIGNHGSKIILSGLLLGKFALLLYFCFIFFILGLFEHVELANIGIDESSAFLFSQLLRDVAIKWKFLNISNNNLSKKGLNIIFWALRHNRHLRVLQCQGNNAGKLTVNFILK